MSKKFTGITSAGSAIPVYDKDAHEALSGKLDTSALDDAITSAVSGKQDTLTFDYNADSAISAINGSALAGGGVATGDYVPLSAANVSIGNANTAYTYSFAQGYQNKADGYAFAQSYKNSASYTAFAQGESNSAETKAFAQGYNNKAYNGGLAQGQSNKATWWSFTQGDSNTAAWRSLAQGYNCSADTDSFANGINNTAYDHSLAQGGGSIAKSYSLAQGGCTAENYSIAQGENCKAYSASQAFGRNVVASGDMMAIGKYNKISANAAFVIGNGSSYQASARSDLFVIDKSGNVSALSGKFYDKDGEVGGGGGGATYSAGANIDITDDVISGKDWTEEITSATSGLQPSGDYYSASNPSGFMTELPASATEAIDTVTANSGTWGGSALPISAGPGIKLEMNNGTLVASVTGQYNETLLWSGVWNSSADTIVLSEPASAFEHVAVTNNKTYCSRYTYDGKSTCWSWFQPYCSNTGTLFYATRFTIDEDGKTVRYGSCGTSRITTAGVVNFTLSNMNVGEVQVTKVVGINRK